MEYPTIEELRLLHDKICKSLGDPTRIQLLYILKEQSHNVSSLAELMELPQPTVSRHLAILRNSSLVSAERDGQSVNYRLAYPEIIEVLESMRAILRESLVLQSSVLD
ncbi:MAG: ArsR/SmtB family transcription factor [Anaerolineales bacterium]|jgi:DNA-binding transcriptional ArsR family regulator